MRVVPLRRLVVVAVILAAGLVSGCRRAVVIVPAANPSYTERDTLYGFARGNRVVVSFRFDSVLRVDTVTRLDTLWRGGTRTIVRVDTVRVPATNAGTSTPSMPTPRVPTRPNTSTPVPPQTVPNQPKSPAPQDLPVGPRTPAAAGRVDTVFIARVDSVFITRVDTLRLAGRDTVLISGRRQLFVPPGQYPPMGLCRVWLHNLPPGQQASPRPCNALGNVPAGAFILFDGEAWDADYDWVAESRRSRVPAQILTFSRGRRP